MGENQKKILQMLSEGKISVEEAQRLLSLVSVPGEDGPAEGDAGHNAKSAPRYLRVMVEPKPGATWCNERRGHHGKVNIRVPLGLIRAGIKFASLMPSETAEHVDRAFKEKGFSFDVKHLKEEDLQTLISALQDSQIEVDNDNESVRIYAE